MRGWAFRGRRPASTTSRSATMRFAIPGLPSNPIVAGGLPSDRHHGLHRIWAPEHESAVAGSSAARSEGELNLGEGTHSLKFGYEYEHVWMAVNDNNPLYGSWTYGGGYSLCDAAISANCATTASGGSAHGSGIGHVLGGLSVWHDERLLSSRTTSKRTCVRRLDSAYAQDDWKVRAEPDAEPGTSVGVRITLFGAGTTTSRTGIRHRRRC